ncbi:acyl-CoA N-acyltransferase [Xylariomycetidae sp. FL0641]|nr:acyl-CoA N-acyltransferase [Xylariomycetidae sp. FL0641]
MSTPTVRLLSPTKDAHLVPYLASIHADCVAHDQMIATFLPPIDQEKLLKYWSDILSDVDTGTRCISILLDESEPGSPAKGNELLGVVVLTMPPSETGILRGIVEKLMVSPKYRQRGGAKALMKHLDSEAIKRGKKVLMLDTEVGSPAELVYPRLGYKEVGRIPLYSVSPSGALKDEVFFYKPLP